MAAMAPPMASPEIKPPSRLLAVTELPRALAELSALGWAAPLLNLTAPRGDGHPILVLPGFITTDISTTVLRRYLDRIGYESHAWELGRNLGPKAIGHTGERLIERLEAVYERTGRKVSLLGWSLGGVMARQLSRRRPDMVRQVITLGSPFTGDPAATNVRQAYEALTGQRIRDAEVQFQLDESRTAPPVPSTAIYTKGDGVVAWENCVEPACATTENIEVYGSHIGLGVNPAVLYAIADRLAQADGEFAPFERSGLKALVYPTSGHA